MKKIILTGGGSAGHVYPAIAVCEKLKDYDVHFIGGNGIEKQIIENEKGITYHQISTVKLIRKLTLKNFLIPFKLIVSINQAKKIIKEINPVVIFSKGGFVSVPVVIAGAKLGIPIVSHECDLSLGLANKIILKYANVMCTTFEKTAKQNKKCIFTGQPIRENVLKGNYKNLGFLNILDKNKPCLLVVGGSLGAKFINEKIWKNIDTLCKRFNVIHITGKNFNKNILKKNYIQLEYCSNFGDILSLCDIAVSRAGSGAINEFKELEIPMLLIPLSKKCSRGDQIENAKYFASCGYADVLFEEDYDDKMLLIKLDNLIKNSEKFKKNMKKNKKNDAKTQIYKILKENELK